MSSDRQIWDPEIWLHCDVRQPRAAQRLVCFPHAGGSASFFNNWGDSLGQVEVHAVRYPGRAERIAEPSPSDLRQLAIDIAKAVEPLADRPIALFGHSMGAAVALESARELERRGIPLAHLFASGSRDAELPAAPGGDFSEDPKEVIRHLVSLGGTDSEAVLDPIFQELVLPYVISDGRMFAAYAMDVEPVLRCPITAIAGDADADADQRPWSALTRAAFRELVAPGGHFYLVADPPLAILSETLTASTSGRTGGQRVEH